jgi:hypothetical protein
MDTTNCCLQSKLSSFGLWWLAEFMRVNCGVWFEFFKDPFLSDPTYFSNEQFRLYYD